MFSKLVALATFLAVICIEFSGTCNTSTNRICVIPNSYQLCMVIGGEVNYVGSPQICPDGTLCSETAVIPCVETSDNSSESSTTTSTTTTNTPATTTSTVKPDDSDGSKVPCTEPGVFPAPKCHQYYLCLKVLGSLKWTLQNCPKGLAFDPPTRGCGPADYLKCTIK